METAKQSLNAALNSWGFPPPETESETSLKTETETSSRKDDTYLNSFLQEKSRPPPRPQHRPSLGHRKIDVEKLVSLRHTEVTFNPSTTSTPRKSKPTDTSTTRIFSKSQSRTAPKYQQARGLSVATSSKRNDTKNGFFEGSWEYGQNGRSEGTSQNVKASLVRNLITGHPHTFAVRGLTSQKNTVSRDWDWRRKKTEDSSVSNSQYKHTAIYGPPLAPGTPRALMP